jgi:predicted RNA polymerase sigma factor
LTLMYMCCHPSLTPASAIPLTLRAVGGLSTREIAAAFLVPERTGCASLPRQPRRTAALGPARSVSPLQRGLYEQQRP